MAADKENALQLLRKNGLKATSQRLAIIQAIMDQREHPTAEEIHARLAERHPTISRSTVYDTLARLTELGIVDALKIGDGATHYEFHNHPHVNVVCVECQRIVDLDTDHIEPFLDHVRQETSHEVHDQQIKLRGRCRDCAKDR